MPNSYRKIHKSSGTTLLFIAGMVIFFLLATLLIQKFSFDDLTTYGNLVIGLMLMTLGIWLTYTLLKIPTITIIDEQIILSKFFHFNKEIIDKKSITSWVLINTNTKNSKYNTLHIILDNGRKIKITGFYYKNFPTLENFVKYKTPQNRALRRILEEKECIKYSLIFLIVSLLSFAIASNSLIQLISTPQYVEINGALSDDINVKKERRKSRIYISYVFRIQEYEDYDFKLHGFALDNADTTEILKDFEKGNHIQLTIEKNDFDKKISKKQKLSLIDKIFHSNNINIKGISDGHKNYVNSNLYQKDTSFNNYLTIGFFGIFGFLTLFASVSLYKKRAFIADKIMKQSL